MNAILAWKLSPTREGPLACRSVALTLALGLLLLPTSAVAIGTVSDGGVTFGYTSNFTTSSGNTVNTQLTGAGTGDLMYESWWFFRVDGASQETAFAAPDAESYVGSVGRLDWSDPGGAGLFSAILDFEVIDGGGSSGNLFQNLRIINEGPTALTIDIFHYTDIDAEGTWNRDWATWMADPGGPALSVTDGNPSSGGETAPLIGYNAAAYQVTDYRGLLNGLTDNGVTNLDDSGLPFSNGDITVGFQWSVTIGVDESDYFRSQVASNTVLLPQNATVVPEPAVVVLLGLGLMALAAPGRSRAH